MKKEKYILFVEYLDTVMVKETPLTKSEYYNQLTYLNTLIEETESTEYPIEHRSQLHETQYFYETVNYFTSGCCTTVLARYSAKDGYVFK